MELIWFIRVIIAGICGITIGFERKNRAKEAGIRTHCIIACAAALMMIVSKYGFFDLIKMGMYDGVEVKLDPSRVASCIITGVGFLGAGMIFVQKQTIKGLTTAAGMWATAGIGMAIGSGLYIIGILVTALIVFAQILLHKNNKFLTNPHYKTLHIYNVDKKGYQEEIRELFLSKNIISEDVEIFADKEKGTFNYLFTIELSNEISEEKLIESIEYNCAIETMR